MHSATWACHLALLVLIDNIFLNFKTLFCPDQLDLYQQTLLYQENQRI